MGSDSHSVACKCFISNAGCVKLMQTFGGKESSLKSACSAHQAGPLQPWCTPHRRSISHETHTPPAAATAIQRDGRSHFFVINKKQCLLKNKRRHKTNKMIHWDFRTHLQTQQEGKILPLPILAAEWDQPKKKHVPTVDSLSLFCQTLRFK